MKKVLLLSTMALSIASFGQIPTSGLVGQWTFSGNANENSGTTNDGTVYGASLTTDLCENANSAYYFDGDDYIECNTDNMGITDAISVSLWFKTTTSGFDALVTKYTWTGDVGYIAQFDAAGAPEIRGRDGNGVFSESNTNGVSYADHEWHHFVGIVDGSVWTTWIDTIMVGSYDNGHTSIDIGSCSLPLTFGRVSEYTGSSWRHYIGSLDDIAIYDRAINYTEVVQLFNDYCSTASTTEQAQLQSIIYPNPTLDELHIRLEGNFEYIVQDYIGKVISKGESTDEAIISTRIFAKGTYLLILKQNGIVSSQSFIQI